MIAPPTLDVIMDMLGNRKMRQLITDYYQCTDEPKLVNQAVKKARSRERKYSMDQMDVPDGATGDRVLTRWEQFKYALIYLFVCLQTCCYCKLYKCIYAIYMVYL